MKMLFEVVTVPLIISADFLIANIDSAFAIWGALTLGAPSRFRRILRNIASI